MRDYFARPTFTLKTAQMFVHVAEIIMDDPVNRGTLTGDEAHELARLRDYLLSKLSLYYVKNEFDQEKLQAALLATHELTAAELEFEEWRKQMDANAHKSLVPEEFRKPQKTLAELFPDWSQEQLDAHQRALDAKSPEDRRWTMDKLAEEVEAERLKLDDQSHSD